MSEELLCKRVFDDLDYYNHKFANVSQDNNALFYYFAFMLKEEGKDEQLAETSKELLNYIKYQMVLKWNAFEAKFQMQYFIKRENISALRYHMKKMEEFPKDEAISNQKAKIYNLMTLSETGVAEVIDMLQDNNDAFDEKQIQGYNRFLHDFL